MFYISVVKSWNISIESNWLKCCYSKTKYFMLGIRNKDKNKFEPIGSLDIFFRVFKLYRVGEKKISLDEI